MAQLNCIHFDQLIVFVLDNKWRMIERVNFFNSNGYWLMVFDYRAHLLKVDKFLIEVVKFEVYFHSIRRCLEFNMVYPPLADMGLIVFAL